MTTDESLHKTWEFKGTEIKPLSRARKFHLSKLVDFTKLTPWDVAVLIYALTCEESTLIKALRDPDGFNAKVSEWIDGSKLEMADFNDETLTIIREVMENSDENRAVPITDPNMLEDPSGN